MCITYWSWLCIFFFREREFQAEAVKSGRSIKRNHVVVAEREGTVYRWDDDIPFPFSIFPATFWRDLMRLKKKVQEFRLCYVECG